MAGETILVVDDDPDIRTFLEVTLGLAGFEIAQAANGREALEQAIRVNPGLVLMDVMMPGVDGLQALRDIREDSRTSHLPVILVTAKAQAVDKVEGLGLGADDYVTKPFDPDELIARVNATLRRSAEMRSLSPLTGLPGNARIERELRRRIESGHSFALLYADLNHFKAYNDHYGFMRGDQVLRGLADVIVDALADYGSPGSFVGHIGGDDFAIVMDAEGYEDVAAAICSRFDALSPGFYDAEDRERGYIELIDRRGEVARFGPVSVSIGIAHAGHRDFEHPTQPVAVATEMKSFAKNASDGTSNWAVDRRREESDGGE